MKNPVFYPGTFDPLTSGHLDIIKRASTIFDGVTVAVAQSSMKKPIFSLSERVEQIQLVLKEEKIENASVIGFSTLLIHAMQEHHSHVLIRGLRAVSDFEYEFQLASMNRHLDKTIETVFFTPSEAYTFISSSMVKEIAALGGDVSDFVPDSIHEQLIERLQKK